VRLELDKKLAASAQKFAEAAKLSAEAKAGAAAIEADQAALQALTAQMDAQSARQAEVYKQEQALRAELDAAQAAQDRALVDALREHVESITYLLSAAKTTQVFTDDDVQATLLRAEQDESEARMDAIREKHRWGGGDGEGSGDEGLDGTSPAFAAAAPAPPLDGLGEAPDSAVSPDPSDTGAAAPAPTSGAAILDLASMPLPSPAGHATGAISGGGLGGSLCEADMSGSELTASDPGDDAGEVSASAKQREALLSDDAEVATRQEARWP